MLAESDVDIISATDITDAAMMRLTSYHWPGNARELDNEIQRALAIATPGEELLPEHFSTRLIDHFGPIEAALDSDGSLRENVARFEAVFIRSALQANGGRRAATARRLQLTREGLYKKMTVGRILTYYASLKGMFAQLIMDECHHLTAQEWQRAGEEMAVLLSPILAFTESGNWTGHEPGLEEMKKLQLAVAPHVREIYRYWLARRAE